MEAYRPSALDMCPQGSFCFGAQNSTDSVFVTNTTLAGQCCPDGYSSADCEAIASFSSAAVFTTPLASAAADLVATADAAVSTSDGILVTVSNATDAAITATSTGEEVRLATGAATVPSLVTSMVTVSGSVVVVTGVAAAASSSAYSFGLGVFLGGAAATVASPVPITETVSGSVVVVTPSADPKIFVGSVTQTPSTPAPVTMTVSGSVVVIIPSAGPKIFVSNVIQPTFTPAPITTTISGSIVVVTPAADPIFINGSAIATANATASSAAANFVNGQALVGPGASESSSVTVAGSVPLAATAVADPSLGTNGGSIVIAGSGVAASAPAMSAPPAAPLLSMTVTMTTTETRCGSDLASSTTALSFALPATRVGGSNGTLATSLTKVPSWYLANATAAGTAAATTINGIVIWTGDAAAIQPFLKGGSFGSMMLYAIQVGVVTCIGVWVWN